LCWFFFRKLFLIMRFLRFLEKLWDFRIFSRFCQVFEFISIFFGFLFWVSESFILKTPRSPTQIFWLLTPVRSFCVFDEKEWFSWELLYQTLARLELVKKFGLSLWRLKKVNLSVKSVKVNPTVRFFASICSNRANRLNWVLKIS
jgi:hypothetical protein